MNESPEAKARREEHQAMTVQIADELKERLPESRGFILVTTDLGPGGTGALAWASRRLNPADGMRALQEFIDTLQTKTNTYGEPTVETATFMREKVVEILGALGENDPVPNPHAVIEHFNKARKGALPEGERSAAYIAMAIAAMVELEHWRRKHRPSEETQRERRLALFEALRLEIDRNAGKWPPGDTRETLVADLLAKPQTANRDKLIGFAKEGLFHDYDSKLAMPKLALLESLLMLGYHDLATKLREGGYDAERASVEQLEELRADAGAEFFDTVIEGKARRPVS